MNSTQQVLKEMDRLISIAETAEESVTLYYILIRMKELKERLEVAYSDENYEEWYVRSIKDDCIKVSKELSVLLVSRDSISNERNEFRTAVLSSYNKVWMFMRGNSDVLKNDKDFCFTLSNSLNEIYKFKSLSEDLVHDIPFDYKSSIDSCLTLINKKIEEIKNEESIE